MKKYTSYGNIGIVLIFLFAILAALVGGYLFLNKDSILKSTGSQEQSAEETASGKKKLIFATHWSLFQLDGVIEDGQLKSKGLKQYLDEYTALHPDIEFEIQSIGFAEYYEKLKILHDTNIAPDIIEINSQWAAPYVAKDMLDAAPEDIAADIKKNSVSTAGVTVKGDIWGYPTEINDYVLLYNKRMFKEAGIDAPPKTWDELVAAAVKLTKKQNGQIVQYGFASLKDDWELTVDPFLALLYSNNGAFVTPDFKKILINSPEAVEVLQAMTQIFKLGASDISANFYDFPKGKIAMVIAPPWVKTNFKKGFGDATFESEVGLAALPVFKKPVTLQYSWMAGVMKRGKHTKEAWEFLKWLATDVQPSTNTTRLGDLLTNTIGAIPARKVDLQNQVALRDFFTSFYVKQLPNAVASPLLIEYDAMRKQLMKELQAAWTGQKTPQVALDDAAKALNTTLTTYYK